MKEMLNSLATFQEHRECMLSHLQQMCAACERLRETCLDTEQAVAEMLASDALTDYAILANLHQSLTSNDPSGLLQSDRIPLIPAWNLDSEHSLSCYFHQAEVLASILLSPC